MSKPRKFNLDIRSSTIAYILDEIDATNVFRGYISIDPILVVEKSAYDKAIKILKFYYEHKDSDEFYFGWNGHEEAECVLKELGELTTCKDCGIITEPGQGSARCEVCWDCKCGEIE